MTTTRRLRYPSIRAYVRLRHPMDNTWGPATLPALPLASFGAFQPSRESSKRNPPPRRLVRWMPHRMPLPVTFLSECRHHAVHICTTCAFAPGAICPMTSKYSWFFARKSLVYPSPRARPEFSWAIAPEWYGNCVLSAREPVESHQEIQPGNSQRAGKADRLPRHSIRRANQSGEPWGSFHRVTRRVLTLGSKQPPMAHERQPKPLSNQTR